MQKQIQVIIDRYKIELDFYESEIKTGEKRNAAVARKLKSFLNNLYSLLDEVTE